ncbi:hypothetical protein FE391_33250 [Nonomuraea sp. KC401]|uniref:hypothetical protein n=1 Tax=unclassified Nonomuraea TaxID=2593643 RepID=UPI0010FEEFA8|nr:MULTISPECIES: hypothetical protein [unclassified Nonomuraea]NBE97328.1 hypothetical protein [Nonomuraea sp. K271]TLF60512.1 hypothetical protein FE391_33250 [Nonomuraea sp. KC401]
MADKRLLAEIAGHIDAPVDQVWPLLRSDLALTETDGRTAVSQGGWWYRGEWSATHDDAGTIIVHRVYNVARQMRWGVPLANRFFIGFPDKTRSGFEQILTRVAHALDADWHLLDQIQ